MPKINLIVAPLSYLKCVIFLLTQLVFQTNSLAVTAISPSYSLSTPTISTKQNQRRDSLTVVRSSQNGQSNANTQVSLSASEKKWLQRHPKIIVGGEADWAPFDFVDVNGKYSGISNDYLTLIAKKTGLQLEVVTDKWDTLLQKLHRKEVDLLPAEYFTESRGADVIFSSPYFDVLDYFFIRDDLSVTSLNDLNGKRVAIPKGYAGEEQLKKYFPKVIILSVESFGEALDAVLENRAELLYDNYATLTYALKKEGINTIKPFKSTRFLGTNALHVITRKDLPELASIIQKGLDALSEREKQDIYQRWIGNDGVTNTPSVALTEAEKKWLLSHPIINLGYESNWPPFEFVDKAGQMQGLSADILLLLEQRLGIHFNLLPQNNWLKTLEKIRNQELDIVSSSVKTPNRDAFLRFSEAYMAPQNVIFTRHDNVVINHFDDLKGKQVAVENGYYLHELLHREFPGINLKIVNNTLEALREVSFGKADAYIGNQGVANWIIEQNALTNLKLTQGTKIANGELRFGVRKDWDIFPGILNKGLESIVNTEMLEIRRKWLGVSPERKSLKVSAAERQWLDDHKTIRFGGDPNWLPYEAFDGKGNYSGIVAEFLKLIEQRLGITLQIIPTSSWLETLEKVKNGTLDVVSETVDSELTQQLKFTQAYLSSPIVIVMRNDQDYVETIDQINQKKIAIIKNYGYAPTVFKHYSYLDFAAVNTTQEGLTQVSTGKVDAFLETLAQISFNLSEMGINNLRIVGKTEFSTKLAFGMRQEYLPLVPLFNRALNDISPAEKQKIFSKWGGKEKFVVKTDYKLLCFIAGALLIIIAFIVYWNRKLRIEVNKREASEREVRLLNDRFLLATDLVNLGVWQFELSTSNSFIFDDRMFELYEMPKRARVSFSEWSHRIHPEDLSIIEASINKLKTQGGQDHVEFRTLRRDGSIRYIYAGVTIIRDECDGTQKLYGVNWDITERKLADAQFKSIIDALPLAILIADKEGKIVLDNPQTIKEISNERSLVGHNTSEYYADPEEKNRITDLLKRDGVISRRHVKYKIGDGKIIDGLLSIHHIIYHEESMWLAVIINLTDRIKIEQDLAEAKNQAERANKAKTVFLANMSHEIRTPMNAILGFTELLSEQIKEPRHKAYVKTIHSAGNALLTLINDILDLTKIEAGKMTIERKSINPHELFAELGDIFMMNIRKKNLDFMIQVDPRIPDSLMLDAIRLRQVLLNVIGNAVKFTEQGFIRLTAKTVNENLVRSKLDLLIEVEDTGIGIPQKELQKIFEEFSQSDYNEKQKFGGTGLGLSISQRLTNLMGGTLTVTSKEGKGSCFTIRLNAIDVASVKAHTLSTPDSFIAKSVKFNPAIILVVDDVENNRRLICENFEGSAIKIIEAENGLEAVKIAEEYPIDLILMDIRMPVMDGYEAAALIKVKKNVPIIALTASVMQDEFERKQCENFAAYLRKPVMRKDLITTLAQYLGHQIIELENLQSDSVKLSAAERKVLPEVLKRLEQQSVQWQSIQENNNISAIKKFANDLVLIADEFGFEPIKIFANQLLNCIASFDINGIKQLLRDYSKLLDSLATAALT